MEAPRAAGRHADGPPHDPRKTRIQKPPRRRARPAGMQCAEPARRKRHGNALHRDVRKAKSLMRFFDDIEVGWRRELGKHTFTAEEIKRFASRYDPQLFHIDEAEAKKSHFGALCASGWHTAAVCMRTIVDSTKQFTADMTARGEKVAKTGPSPGFTNLKWLKPVYA